LTLKPVDGRKVFPGVDSREALVARSLRVFSYSDILFLSSCENVKAPQQVEGCLATPHRVVGHPGKAQLGTQERWDAVGGEAVRRGGQRHRLAPHNAVVAQLQITLDKAPRHIVDAVQAGCMIPQVHLISRVEPEVSKSTKGKGDVFTPERDKTPLLTDASPAGDDAALCQAAGAGEELVKLDEGVVPRGAHPSRSAPLVHPNARHGARNGVPRLRLVTAPSTGQCLLRRRSAAAPAQLPFLRGRPASEHLARGCEEHRVVATSRHLRHCRHRLDYPWENCSPKHKVTVTKLPMLVAAKCVHLSVLHDSSRLGWWALTGVVHAAGCLHHGVVPGEVELRRWEQGELGSLTLVVAAHCIL
ncbi:unnamed protein product, partial [Ixodes hexagonus]